MLTSLGAGHFIPYLFSSLNCLYSTKFRQQLQQGDPIKGKQIQCSSSTNAHNLSCTAVRQSGSNSALGTFLGRKDKKNAIRMAILRSAKAESDLQKLN